MQQGIIIAQRGSDSYFDKLIPPIRKQRDFSKPMAISAEMPKVSSSNVLSNHSAVSHLSIFLFNVLTMAMRSCEALTAQIARTTDFQTLLSSFSIQQRQAQYCTVTARSS